MWVKKMLRIILEAKHGTMTDAEFSELKDLVDTDIRVNRTNFGKRTSFAEKVKIAERCIIALGRGMVA